VALFDTAARHLNEERPEPDKAVAALNAIKQDTLQPSQEMRFAFLLGRSRVAEGSITEGIALFHQAEYVAREHKDRDSACEILLRIGHTAYNAQRHQAALDFYKITYDTWLDYFPDPRARRNAAEVMLRTAIGTEQWFIGKINEARQTLEGVVSLVKTTPKTEHSIDLDSEHANALWMLGLTFRTLSDMHGGDNEYLHDAISRLRKAISLYKRIGVPDFQMGRVTIQIAEAYLDLTELHLHENNLESARSMRTQAKAHVEYAADYLNPAGDPEGRVLARITKLRLKMIKTRVLDSLNTYQSIENDFATIERDPITQKDEALMAKSLTLRAEWLIKLGDVKKGCDALKMAIEIFGSDGKGMATRAERLSREHCSKLLGPEVPFGGYDNFRN
jgi:tetratricopeptide (TPR) repeat protein